MNKSNVGRGMKYYRYRPDTDHFAGIGIVVGKEEPPADKEMTEEEWTEKASHMPFRAAHHKWTVDVHFTDKPLAKQWETPITTNFKEDPPTQGDFPSLNEFWTVPVMSEKAWNVLQPLIGNCCEALPVIHPTGSPYFIVHVMKTIDCLDVTKSEFWCNPSSGRMGDISCYAFKPGLLRGKHIFKLPIECTGELIVDDTFRQVVEANGLKGLLFDPLPMGE
jgi:hypothetical protein